MQIQEYTIVVNAPMYRRRYKYFYLFLYICALLTLFPLPVHADGGAPNLAYVAGAGQGIRVIDIAQQRIIRTLAVAGDPHTILLSSDGSIIYVTQPALGQVSELATRTGHLLCSIRAPGNPTLLALSGDGTLLYIAGEASSQVTVLDTATCAIQYTYRTHENISGLAVTTVVFNNTIRNQLL